MVKNKINNKFHIKNTEMNLYFLAEDRIELTTKDFQSHTLPIKLFGSPFCLKNKSRLFKKNFTSIGTLQKVGFSGPLHIMFFFGLKFLSFYKQITKLFRYTAFYVSQPCFKKVNSSL
jgi:hypothetical protein